MRAEFGATWSDFVRDWCLGVEPTESPIIAWSALETLDRLWPEYLDRIVTMPLRGIAVITPAIHIGTVLKACEPLTGFPEVLARIRQGEQSALSEAVITAALASIGYCPELGPILGKNRLDVLVQTEDAPVYIEVISPDRADAIVEVHNAIHTLARRICEAQKGMKIELLVEVEVNQAIADRAVSFLENANVSSQIQEIPGIGKFIKERSDGNLVVAPRITHASETTILGAAFSMSAESTLAAVRTPISDSRVQRLFTAELHHFSKSATNLLIVDVTRASGGIPGWQPLIQRRFQPTQNRRIGAVVLYASGIVAGSRPTLKQTWRVLQNPHCYRPIPESLLVRIRALDPARDTE
jgi:hypothetical protein